MKMVEGREPWKIFNVDQVTMMQVQEWMSASLPMLHQAMAMPLSAKKACCKNGGDFLKNCR